MDTGQVVQKTFGAVEKRFFADGIKTPVVACANDIGLLVFVCPVNACQLAVERVFGRNIFT